jgi:hypothetical protein
MSQQDKTLLQAIRYLTRNVRPESITHLYRMIKRTLSSRYLYEDAEFLQKYALDSGCPSTSANRGKLLIQRIRHESAKERPKLIHKRDFQRLQMCGACRNKDGSPRFRYGVPSCLITHGLITHAFAALVGQTNSGFYALPTLVATGYNVVKNYAQTQTDPIASRAVVKKPANYGLASPNYARTQTDPIASRAVVKKPANYGLASPNYARTQTDPIASRAVVKKPANYGLASPNYARTQTVQTASQAVVKKPGAVARMRQHLRRLPRPRLLRMRQYLQRLPRLWGPDSRFTRER